LTQNLLADIDEDDGPNTARERSGTFSGLDSADLMR